MALDINFTWSFSIAFCNWSTFPETNRFSLSARRSTGAIGKLTIYFLLSLVSERHGRWQRDNWNVRQLVLLSLQDLEVPRNLDVYN